MKTSQDLNAMTSSAVTAAATTSAATVTITLPSNSLTAT
jgi:hypothetical protein